MDSQDNFFVNERGNERVQNLRVIGIPLARIQISSNNQFCHEDLALDKVYVTDPQSEPACSMQPRVLKYDSYGEFITKFGSYGTEPGELRDPEHLALDNGNVLYQIGRTMTYRYFLQADRLSKS